MNRENFFRKYDKIVAGFGDTKPSILLHSCCGPCSTSVLEQLAEAAYILPCRGRDLRRAFDTAVAQ